MAEEHASNGAKAYAEAVGQLTSLTTEYCAKSKIAVDAVTAADRCVKAAHASLEKAKGAADQAALVAGADATAADPWSAELARQLAADALVGGLTQHKAKFESASRDFSNCEDAGRSRFISIIADTLSKVCQVHERVQVGLSRAGVSIKSMNHQEDSAYWQSYAANATAAETEAANNLWRQCSMNALESSHVEKSTAVSRPGLLKLTWSSAFAVLTSTGRLHIFDTMPVPASTDGLQPRLVGAPGTSLSLRDCTASMSEDNPASLKVKIIYHSKFLPATTYMFKLATQEDVIDLMISLKKLLPQDSIWMQKQVSEARVKNERFYMKNYKPRAGYQDRQAQLYSQGDAAQEPACNGQPLATLSTVTGQSSNHDVPEAHEPRSEAENDVVVTSASTERRTEEDLQSSGETTAETMQVTSEAPDEAQALEEASDPEQEVQMSAEHGFDGTWTSNNGNQYLINGDTLSAEGQILKLRVTDSTVIEVVLEGSSFDGLLQADGTVHWSDGQIWARPEDDRRVQS